jgi:hypothetical protein
MSPFMAGEQAFCSTWVVYKKLEWSVLHALHLGVLCACCARAADKVKKPLLLIHGESDENPGTFPLQSERFYQV